MNTIHLLIFACLSCPAIVSAQEAEKPQEESAMEMTFGAWDAVRSFYRIKEGAILCMVFDLEAKQEVEKFVVGEAEIEPSTMRVLESVTRGAFDVAARQKYFQNLNPENAGNAVPKFVCVIRQESMKQSKQGPIVVFSAKPAAIAFAKTFKRAAEAQRRL